MRFLKVSLPLRLGIAYIAAAKSYHPSLETIAKAKPNLAVLKEYRRREKEFLERAQDLEKITQARDAAKKQCDDMRKQRLDEFMAGFNVISMKLKEMYQVSRAQLTTTNVG